MSDQSKEIPIVPTDEDMTDLSFEEALTRKDLKPSLKSRFGRGQRKALEEGSDHVRKGGEGILKGMQDTRIVPADEFTDHVDTNIIGITKPPPKK